MTPKELRNRPIAVIDSGIGGLSVLRELIALMPNESFLFFGDEANAPYGIKSHNEVLRITRENVETLRQNDHIKAVVIACNTATGAAVRELREAYPDFPIVGIEPEIKSAATVCEHPSVLVMATPLTLKQPKFLALRDRFADKADFTLLPCPGLMELIESGHREGALLESYLDSLLSYLDGKAFDAVVLGCTHYPFIRQSIQRRYPDTPVYDGCHGTAAEAKRRLAAAGLLCDSTKTGSVQYRSSGDSVSFAAKCASFMMQ